MDVKSPLMLTISGYFSNQRLFDEFMAQDKQVLADMFRSAAFSAMHDVVQWDGKVDWAAPIVSDCISSTNPNIVFYDEVHFPRNMNVTPANAMHAHVLMNELKEFGLRDFLLRAYHGGEFQLAVRSGDQWSDVSLNRAACALFDWFLEKNKYKLHEHVRCSLSDASCSREIAFFNRFNGRVLLVDLAKLSCILFGNEHVFGTLSMERADHGENGDKIVPESMSIFRRLFGSAIHKLCVPMLVAAYERKLRRCYKRSECFARYASLCYQEGSWKFSGVLVTHVINEHGWRSYLRLYYAFYQVTLTMDNSNGNYTSLLAQLKAKLDAFLPVVEAHYCSEERDAKSLATYDSVIVANHATALRNRERYEQKMKDRREARQAVLTDIKNSVKQAVREPEDSDALSESLHGDVMRREGDSISFDNTEEHVCSSHDSIFSH